MRRRSWCAPAAVVTVADDAVYATFVTSTPVWIFTPLAFSFSTNAFTSEEYLQVRGIEGRPEQSGFVGVGLQLSHCHSRTPLSQVPLWDDAFALGRLGAAPPPIQRHADAVLQRGQLFRFRSELTDDVLCRLGLSIHVVGPALLTESNA